MLGREVAYLATNPDLVCPVSFGYIPDCGSMSIMLKNATGKTPFFIGKPEPIMIDCVLKKLGISKEDTVIVGDRIYTDIACGVNAGVDTICVLSGEATLDDLEKSDTKPTWIFDSVREVCTELGSVAPVESTGFRLHYVSPTSTHARLFNSCFLCLQSGHQLRHKLMKCCRVIRLDKMAELMYCNIFHTRRRCLPELSGKSHDLLFRLTASPSGHHAAHFNLGPHYPHPGKNRINPLTNFFHLLQAALCQIPFEHPSASVCIGWIFLCH